MKRRIFGLSLIIIGLIFVGSALFMRYSADRRQKRMLQDFQQTLQSLQEEDSSGSSLENSAQTNEAQATSGGTNSDQLSEDKKPNTQDIKATAIMVIPKINLRVAVAEGTDSQTLKYAVGHFTGTALPGEKGNFCVAGHRSYTYSEYFNRLDELKAGDEIIVRTKKGEFSYVVNEIKVVEPTEISVLDQTKDATITLVTCTPIRVATHRLIIKGKLK